jgi:hypothetical protein
MGTDQNKLNIRIFVFSSHKVFEVIIVDSEIEVFNNILNLVDTAKSG